MISAGSTQRTVTASALSRWTVPSGSAAEDEGDDAEAQILVDAGEPVDLNVEAGLFEDFAVHAVLELLDEFEDPRRVVPSARCRGAG